MRFGSTPEPALVSKPVIAPQIRTTKVIKEKKEKDRVVVEKKIEQTPAKQTLGALSSGNGSYGGSRGVYVVREGDTLDSIAEKVYGKSSAWPRIYTANKHLIDDPEQLPVGQKIILPQ
jgi:nucleoid-associated protein YgaU